MNYAPDGWKEAGANPESIIFYKHTGKISSFNKADDFFDAVPACKDYGEAQKARDKDMEGEIE